ncbi:CNBP [Mytilus edulis]|uniref:CNBP n=1 Tax=Mytilus edulis TaxID=6550 RepID=A0A8S3TFU6_MYTED|nr:CNBP [Mytilus edulis]
MADQQVGEIFQALAHTLGQLSDSIGSQGHNQQALSAQVELLSNTVGTQSVSQVIPSFGGNPKEFQEWMKAVEKYAVLTHAIGNADRVKLIAYQSSKVAVSDYLKRYLTANDQATWEECKTQLTARLSEVTEPQHAFSLLRQVKQNTNETVQVFAERLMALVAEAYIGQPRDVEPVERQIIGFFVDGLLLDKLKMKIMRDNPATLEAAITLAMTEQNLITRFGLRTKGSNVRLNRDDQVGANHQPMEVDHYRSARRCHKCGKIGHFAKDCRSNPPRKYETHRVNLVQQRSMAEVECYFCRGKGHFQRYCPQRNRQGN